MLIVAEDHILSSSSSLDSSPRTSLSAFTSRITPAFASPEHEISCKGAELPMGGWFHRCRCAAAAAVILPPPGSSTHGWLQHCQRL